MRKDEMGKENYKDEMAKIIYTEWIHEGGNDIEEEEKKKKKNATIFFVIYI